MMMLAGSLYNYPNILETKLLKELLSEAKMPGEAEGGGGRGTSDTGR